MHLNRLVLVGVVKPFLDMLQSVFKVYLRASKLQVDQGVPNLLRLVIRESSLALNPIGIMRHILEHVVVPKDRVLDEQFVSVGSHSSRVQIRLKSQHISLHFHIDVVVEKAISSEVASYEYFKSADELTVTHPWHVHGEHRNDPLKEVAWYGFRDALQVMLLHRLR